MSPSPIASGTKLTPLHRLWRALPAGPRRRAWAHGQALLAPRPDRAPPPPAGGVAVGGEVSRPSGLGEGARLMEAALRQLGVPAWSLDCGDPVPGAVTERRQPVVPPDGVPLVLHVNAPMMPWAARRLPRPALRHRRVIGYWAWELPVVPAGWRIGLPFVHEVWVPSTFTAAALRGLLPRDMTLRVVPHPVAVAPPAPSPLGRAAFGLPEDAVVVLVAFNLGSSFERKNPLGAIAAFRAAFGARPDRVLVLKMHNASHFPADFERLRAAVGEAPNIRLDARALAAPDLHALMACADIVLSLHRSEGFGLVPAEAMLLGRAVVATGWSGNMDYMDAESAALVRHTLVPARDPRGVFEAPGAVWADPDLDDAVDHLRRLADDTAARAALAAAGQAAARLRLDAQALEAVVDSWGIRRAPAVADIA
jgi:glycosyltransferase involved in cell wall biosynthesis